MSKEKEINPMMQAHSEIESSSQIAQVQENSTPMVIQASPMGMLQTMVERGDGLDKIEKMMELAERFEKREAEKAYNVAMAEFKSNLPHIVKDVNVKYKTSTGQTEYSHASLAQIAEKVSASMGKYGLSHKWITSQDKGVIKVTCVVTHKLGHSEETSLESVADTSGGKNSIQGIGSAITYLERYTLCAITGISAHEQDDDGADADDNKKSPPNDNSGSKDYPQDSFDKNFPEWKAKIESGAKSKKDLVAFIKGKGNITSAQLDAIDKIEVIKN